MLPQEFLKTFYLGDRCVQKIIIDCDKNRILIEVDVISRLREGTISWDYYTDEDILNGLIVFLDVKKFTFDSNMPIPNNGIVIHTEVVNLGGNTYQFDILFDHVDKQSFKQLKLTIECSGIGLIDPLYPEDMIS